MAGRTAGLGPKAAEDGAVPVEGHAHAVAAFQAGTQLCRQRVAPQPHRLLPEVSLQGGPQGPVQLLQILLKGHVHQQLGRAARRQPLLGLRLDRLQQGQGQSSPQRGSLLPLRLPALRLQRPVQGQLQLGLLQPRGRPGAGARGPLLSRGVRLLLGLLLGLLLPQPLGRRVLPTQALQAGQQLLDLLWERGETRGEGQTQPGGAAGEDESGDG